MKRKPPALHTSGIDIDPEATASFECTYPVELITGYAHRFLAEYEFPSCAGRYFTHRQSIKRKAANWGRRYLRRWLEANACAVLRQSWPLRPKNRNLR